MPAGKYHRSVQTEELTIGGKTLRFYKLGLSEEEQVLVRSISTETLSGAVRRFPYALERCTFFADIGYDSLVEAVRKPGANNPRIEGDDKNPFNQHYWLAFNLTGTESRARPVILDPIFGYAGLEEHAPDLLDDNHVSYYRRKRIVPPHKPQWEGGVRIKTTGL
ncbi:MAG: hypothetical protein HY516_05380 [Candidatus Aenigmarchaeota archaeon]|nr:hypothetical protein [Candidatus Aenigmarchaeota archaeon]